MKELEVAAARAAHDGTLQIEAALAEAASRTLTVAEVAELRGRLLEEQTAAADAIAARRALRHPPFGLQRISCEASYFLAALDAGAMLLCGFVLTISMIDADTKWSPEQSRAARSCSFSDCATAVLRCSRRAAEAELELTRSQQAAGADAVVARERLEQQLLAARAELAEVRRCAPLGGVRPSFDLAAARLANCAVPSGAAWRFSFAHPVLTAQTASLVKMCQLAQARIWLYESATLLCRLSQLTPPTGSGGSEIPPSVSVANGDTPPTVSDDTAREDDSPVLATGSGAAEEPAAVAADLPETGAVSHQTVVQGFDDRADDSESR